MPAHRIIQYVAFADWLLSLKNHFLVNGTTSAPTEGLGSVSGHAQWQKVWRRGERIGRAGVSEVLGTHQALSSEVSGMPDAKGQ